MSRKVRIEFPGARYHVINRGNYRAAIFASEGAKRAFETCLFEACLKTSWRLHAFTIMSNHYHLALETPEPNLVEGMHWLQSTYASRFNRFRDERGHVFQGRYESILAETVEDLGAVAHYIHLNPVRARICAVSELGDYRYSSAYYLRRVRLRPAFLDFGAVLQSAGELPDSPAGWKRYQAYLEWLAADEPAQQKLAFESMNQAWVIGSEEFKRALLAEHRLQLEAAPPESVVQSEVRNVKWSMALDAARRTLGLRAPAIDERKAADWKVALATHLRATTTASNTWLAETLQMGTASSVSRYVIECRRGHRPEARRLLDRLARRRR